MHCLPLSAPLPVRLGEPHAQTSLYWLGQAGFAVAGPGFRGLIDPYLSDHLALKYAGSAFDHRRLMPAPIRVEELPALDFVLCTHRHGDHLDPVSLPRIAARFPACRVVVPAPEVGYAAGLGVPAAQLQGAVTGQPLALAGGVAAWPVPAAHEERRRDPAGRDHFLGYCCRAPDGTFYHSGDCVPFPGLVAAVRAHRPSAALLPVNGRDPARRAAGVPGNFTLDEAVALADALGGATLLAHHHGMFGFNSLPAAVIDARASPRLRRARLDTEYRLADHDP